MIELFAHNKTAYDSAVSMLSDVGKAAIIHPTGTGKSFIGFKLCEDHPDGTVCWLSPSEYIFKTQLENLAKASEGYAPENVRFFTYAKLMLLSEAEIDEIAPDFIILDEFHRCGAQEWGKGVEKLLKAYPDVPILGLSATNIRYLDNQRDMADELFDGNIASEMTLGEAIVRGILAAPKYVLSVFSYQKDLEKYQARVRRAKSRLVRDAAERYLEALRRALDKADGLDTVFEKHMTEKTGKYIVFCANFEHMWQIIGKAPAELTQTRVSIPFIPTTRRQAGRSGSSKRITTPRTCACSTASTRSTRGFMWMMSRECSCCARPCHRSSTSSRSAAR